MRPWLFLFFLPLGVLLLLACLAPWPAVLVLVLGMLPALCVTAWLLDLRGRMARQGARPRRRLINLFQARQKPPTDLDAQEASLLTPMRDWHSSPPGAAQFSGYPVGVDRVLEDTESELGMGGPRLASLLLADGMLVEEVWLERPQIATQDAQGSCRALLCGRAEEIVLADLATHTRYTLMPEIGRSSIALLSQWSLLAGDERAAAVRAAMARCQPEPCVAVRGLWLTAALAAEHLAAHPGDEIQRRLPSGRQLRARTLLPPDLRAARNPACWIRLSPRTLELDGSLTPHHVWNLNHVAESHDGRTLVLEGALLKAGKVYEGVYHLARLVPGQAPRWFAVRSWAWSAGYSWSLGSPRAEDDGTVSWDLAKTDAPAWPAVIELPALGLGEPVLRLPVHAARVAVTLPEEGTT